MDGFKKTVLRVTKYRAGYEVRTEEVHDSAFGGKPLVVKSAYTTDGKYIGSPRDARLIVVKRGIKPEYRTKTSRCCSVGFCEAEQKWYGWSHRAMCGFGVGDMIFEERFGDGDTPFVKHGKKPIKSLRDAKTAAARFAASVS